MALRSRASVLWASSAAELCRPAPQSLSSRLCPGRVGPLFVGRLALHACRRTGHGWIPVRWVALERGHAPPAARHSGANAKGLVVVPLSAARRGRPRVNQPTKGLVRVEVRLPVETAALVYEAANNRAETVSATVDALLRDALATEVGTTDDT